MTQPIPKTLSPYRGARGLVSAMLYQMQQVRGLLNEDEVFDEVMDEAEEFLQESHSLHICVDENLSGELEVFWADKEAEAWVAARKAPDLSDPEDDDSEVDDVNAHLKHFVFDL